MRYQEEHMIARRYQLTWPTADASPKVKRKKKKKPVVERPCTKCGGKVDPNLGPITLIAWLCAACTTMPARSWTSVQS